MAEYLTAHRVMYGLPPEQGEKTGKIVTFEPGARIADRDLPDEVIAELRAAGALKTEAEAQTPAETQSEIERLRAQVAELQRQMEEQGVPPSALGAQANSNASAEGQPTA